VTASFKAIAPRPAPVRTEGLLPWVRANLFGGWINSVVTLAIGALLVTGLWGELMIQMRTWVGAFEVPL